MATLGELLDQDIAQLCDDARKALAKQRKKIVRVYEQLSKKERKLLQKEREVRKELEDLQVLQRTVSEKLVRLNALRNSNRVETASYAQLKAWLNGHE